MEDQRAEILTLVPEGVGALEKELVEAGHSLSQLFEQPGWKVFERIIFDNIDACTQGLIDENDPERMKRYQHQLRAYNNVLGHARSLVNQARLYLQKNSEE